MRYSCACLRFCRYPCITLKKVGTKNSVETVANIRPPMTARPSGAFCSPPSPNPKRHRHHANDHGQSGHQHRPKAREARLQCCRDRVFAFRPSAPWRN